MSDEDGIYNMERIQAGRILKVSCLGYSDVYAPLDADSIVFKSKSSVLGEVVVRARMYQQTTDGIIVNVSSGSLAKMGGMLLMC